MARKKHLINVHTGTGTTAPTGASLYLGEIAVQHTSGDPSLWIKVGESEESDTYEKFIGETRILEMIGDGGILGSAYTYTGISYVNSATTIAAAYSALTKGVIEAEKVTSAALNDLNSRVDELSGNTGGGADAGPLSAAVISLSAGVKTNEYVTSAALNLLNDKIDELSGSSGGGTDIQPLSSATHSHITDTAIHVTAQDKTAWNGKQDEITDLAAIRNGANSGASAWTAVAELSAATESHVQDGARHLPSVTSSDNRKVMMVVDGQWTPTVPTTVYVGSTTPQNSLGNNGDIYIQI